MAWFYSKFRSNSEYQKATLVLVLTTCEIPILFRKKTIYPKLPQKKKNLFSTSQVYVMSGERHHMIIYYLSSPTIPIPPPKKTAPPNKKKILETLS